MRHVWDGQLDGGGLGRYGVHFRSDGVADSQSNSITDGSADAGTDGSTNGVADCQPNSIADGGTDRVALCEPDRPADRIPHSCLPSWQVHPRGRRRARST